MDNHLICPECGCPDAVVHDDGTAECMGCGFVSSVSDFYNKICEDD